MLLSWFALLRSPRVRSSPLPRQAMALGLLAFTTSFATEAAPGGRPANNNAHVRAGQFAQGFGTYAGEPRDADGRVDRARLLRELADSHAQTYSWLIWRGAHDWEDLQAFLPEARKQKLRVWVTLVPPSESPPRQRNYSEPFRLDYEKWGEAIARLSLTEPALVGWSIDDFTQNRKDLTPARMSAIIAATRAINPTLAFFPCCYFGATTPKFIEDYGASIDGIFFPYRSESTKANLSDDHQVAAEVAELRRRLGPDKAVVLMVYASAHSRLGASTNAYVEAVMKAGHECADGVIVYVHQDPKRSPEKSATITSLFATWAASAAGTEAASTVRAR